MCDIHNRYNYIETIKLNNLSAFYVMHILVEDAILFGLKTMALICRYCQPSSDGPEIVVPHG